MMSTIASSSWHTLTVVLSIPSVGQRPSLQYTPTYSTLPYFLFFFNISSVLKSLALDHFLNLIESPKWTCVFDIFLHFNSILPFPGYMLHTLLYIAARRWQICHGLCSDPYAQHALQHRAVGWVCVSECDLPSGVVWGTGADTVSLLTLGRELAPPTECGTYASHSLWLWDVCAGMHTCKMRKYGVCVCVSTHMNL